MKEEEQLLLKQQEAEIMNTLKKALASGEKLERHSQPAIVIENKEPPEIPELSMGDMIPSEFTGEDAVRYLARLTLTVRKGEELEEEVEGVSDEGEEVALVSRKGEDHVSGDKSVKKKNASEKKASADNGKNTSKTKTKKKKRKKRKPSKKPRPSHTPSDPQRIARSAIYEELERETAQIIKEAAEALNRNQTPVLRETKAYTIPGSATPPPPPPPPSETTPTTTEAPPTTAPKVRKTQKEIRDEEIRKRFPGTRAWPTLEECEEKPLPKTVVFTSTWLSVTAKGVK